MPAADNIVSFVRGFGERKRKAKVRDSLKNYMANPERAIKEINEVAPSVAIDLNDRHVQTTAAAAKAQETQAREKQQHYLGAVQNMAKMLRSARDGGGDVNVAYDTLSPVMEKGLGMSPEEIASWKLRISENPKLIDMLEQRAEQGLKVVAPGGAVFDQDNKEVVFRNPALPSIVKTEDGSVISVPRGPGGVEGGGAQGSYTGPRKGINPKARGVRNNNMGNIKDGRFARSQPGYVGSDGTFAKFATAAHGNRAQETLLRGSYFGKGLNTVNSIVDKYLGKGDGENSRASRANYKAYVAGRLNVDANQPISTQRLRELGQAMREFENGGGPVKGSSRKGGGASVVYKGGSQGVRMLTREEKQARGLDPATPYQVQISGKSRGRVTKVAERPRSQRALTALDKSPEIVIKKRKAVTNMRDLKTAAQRLLGHKGFEQATGSIDALLPSFRQDSVDFDATLDGIKSKIMIETMKSLKDLSSSGATGMGNLSNAEGQRLQDFQGSLNPRSPKTLRQTLNDVVKFADRNISYIEGFGQPSKKHIQMLKNDPTLADFFNDRYGEGSAAKYIGN